MRVDLHCPYEDKEKAKSLGARWDPDKRTWYVVNPKDINQFKRWMGSKAKSRKKWRNKMSSDSRKPRITVGVNYVGMICSCSTPPWEDCPHTT